MITVWLQLTERKLHKKGNYFNLNKSCRQNATKQQNYRKINKKAVKIDWKPKQTKM